MKKKIKVGLVGAGGMARRHLEVMSAVQGLEPVGITSRTMSKAEKIASEFNIPFCVKSMSELVERANPDALMILVSEDQMFNVSREAIDFKLPLFIEKPAGLSPEENFELMVKAEQNSIPNMVGFNRRYYSVFHQGLKVIKQHGRLLGVLIEGHERMWKIRESGNFSDLLMNNWLFANSVHTIDLLRFFGGEVKDLKVISHRAFNEKHGDQFAAICELESGAIGEYIAHWYSPGGWRIVLYGEKITVEFKPLEKGFITNEKFEIQEIVPDEKDQRFRAGFFGELEAFARLARGEGKDGFMQNLEGSHKTMLLAQKLSEKVRNV